MQGTNPKVRKEKLEAFVPPVMRTNWRPATAPTPAPAEEAA
jgi:hypothetical protein